MWVKSLLPSRYRTKLLRLVRTLLDSAPDRGILTEELCGQSGLAPARFRTDAPQGRSRQDTYVLSPEALFGFDPT